MDKLRPCPLCGNKNALSEDAQEAVEECAAYVLYTLFNGRDEFLKFVEENWT